MREEHGGELSRSNLGGIQCGGGGQRRNECMQERGNVFSRFCTWLLETIQNEYRRNTDGLPLEGP